LVLKTTPKPIAECLAANFQADVLDQLDCTGASRQARDEHFAHRQCKVNFNTRNGF